ncbi:hypothetical protein BG262_03145 [Floricoccus penangensis]|uniref:Mid-cell-anchored protein Z n=1 Tax=Floricoccus penangensis TaxID=1859475 RepID=A0A9Q5NZQ9_9LACT|nr:cell division site-positioning protein MapZ family protein [Floricoccus penangensis]OFI46805.1 hypothetical protein BG262_03145 [Floricoccus penangensis]
MTEKDKIKKEEVESTADSSTTNKETNKDDSLGSRDVLKETLETEQLNDENKDSDSANENKLNNDLDDSEEIRIHKEEVLDFVKASDLTIEEIRDIAEAQENKNKENESVLDAYIRQHRGEIEASKKIRKEDIIDHLNELAEKNPQLISEVNKTDEKIVPDNVVNLVINKDETKKDENNSTDEDILKKSDEDSDLEKSKTKSKKTWVYVLLALLALFAAGGIAVTQANKKAAMEREEQALKAANLKKKEDNFESLFNTYYTDDKHTAVKNDMINSLDELKDALEKTKDTDKYNEFKGEVDNLKKQVDSLNVINSKFNKPVIVDGKLIKDAHAKPNVDFVVNKSGLPELDQTIDEAVAMGKKQQAEDIKKAEEAKKKAEQDKKKAEEAKKKAEDDKKAQDAAAQAAAQQAQAAQTEQQQSAASNQTQGGIDNLSRVPINQAAVDDTSNPAWLWKDGVLDGIVNTSRQRGYFKGNEYYVTPVNIINGNGYYNMYKTDGTYLFSINCKTGYYFGNGSSGSPGKNSDF